MNRQDPSSSSSAGNPSSKIAQAKAAISASQRQTFEKPANNQATLYAKLPPKPPQFRTSTGSTNSASNRPSSDSDMYFISPDALPQSSHMPLQRSGGYQRPSMSGTAGSIRRLQGWKNKKDMRASNENLVDEFPESAVILYNQANVGMKLSRKPLGNYLIHKGQTNTDNCPYTIYANHDTKKTTPLGPP